MSRPKVRSALQGALNAMTPVVPIQWEDVPSPAVAAAQAALTPYQVAHLMFATPINNEVSRSYAEHGLLQVTFATLKDQGPEPGDAHLEAIRAKFYRGATFVFGGLSVNISDTPGTLEAYPEADRRKLPIRIPFHAHITV